MLLVVVMLLVAMWCSVVYNVDGPHSGNFKPFRRDVKTALTPLAPLARRSKTANRGRLGRKTSANIFLLVFAKAMFG